MSDPRIIPLLDPEPTTEEWDQTGNVCDAIHVAAERVRIARQAIEWAISKIGNPRMDCCCYDYLGDLLQEHDTAIAERGKK